MLHKGWHFRTLTATSAFWIYGIAVAAAPGAVPATSSSTLAKFMIFTLGRDAALGVGAVHAGGGGVGFTRIGGGAGRPAPLFAADGSRSRSSAHSACTSPIDACMLAAQSGTSESLIPVLILKEYEG
jgi:hypothetical protein